MPESPQKDDPEGTETMSQKEYRQRQETVTRETLGTGQQKENKDPEGTERKS